MMGYKSVQTDVNNVRVARGNIFNYFDETKCIAHFTEKREIGCV